MLVYPWYLLIIRTWRQVDSTKFSEVFLLKFYNILADLSYPRFFIGSMKTKRGGSITPKFANTFPSGKSWCYGVATACYVQDQRKLQPDCIVQWHNSVPQHSPSIAFIRTIQFFAFSYPPKQQQQYSIAPIKPQKTDIWKVFRTQTPQDFQSSCFYWGLQCFWSIFWAYWVMYHMLAVLAASEHRNVVLPL